MSLLEAHRKLLALGVATLTTGDIAAATGSSTTYAAQIARRLAASGHLVRLARGRWALPDRLKPFALPEALTAPKPSYVSLYSALYHHGLIEQVPDIIYAVTLGPTHRAKTPVGVVSLHHVVPSFFTGFEVTADLDVKLAVPEKALVDTLYLRPARTGLFRALPEVEIPRRFSGARARGFAKLIRAVPRRMLVEGELERLLATRVRG
jgi:predicted transcriptional regulator of viral defense system